MRTHWKTYLSVAIAIVAVLGLLFQIGHFFEHAIQFLVYLFGDRSAAWMSAPAMWLVHLVGGYFFPAADMPRQMMMGMEILHLIGNGIFLTAIACTYYFVRSKWVRYAFYVELFHLYEHIMLTTSAYFLGKPIGLSTLFGGALPTGGQEFAVGYRVTWHFIMNLVPPMLLMVGLMPYWKRWKESRTKKGR